MRARGKDDGNSARAHVEDRGMRSRERERGDKDDDDAKAHVEDNDVRKEKRRRGRKQSKESCEGWRKGAMCR